MPLTVPVVVVLVVYDSDSLGLHTHRQSESLARAVTQACILVVTLLEVLASPACQSR